ncbi:MAG: hypothetical protein JEZ09_11035 [Salinivirgaceae bacterium]|nr:hypothetical protein [Salinivirgaceae bacterium]
MTKNNFLKLSFYIAFVASAIILFVFLKQLLFLIENAADSKDIMLDYNLFQKRIGLINICSFVVLLLTSLIEYYKNNNSKLIILANILFMAVSLFLYVSINKSYYQLSGINYLEQSGYWLTLFMGVFYIIGGLLISAIGFITVRNNLKRKK